MISGFCITAAIICKVIEKDNKEFSSVISIATVAMVLLCIITQISQVTDTIKNLFIQAGIENDYTLIILKSLGICYITQLGSSCCKDCGESSMAMVVETAGKIGILIIAMPLFNALTTIIKTLLE